MINQRDTEHHLKGSHRKKTEKGLWWGGKDEEEVTEHIIPEREAQLWVTACLVRQGRKLWLM